MLRPGLYRLKYGARLVRSTFNYDTQTIGPYKCPVYCGWSDEASPYDNLQWYRYYECMEQFKDALAIWNCNNYCFYILTNTNVFAQPYYEWDETAYKLPYYKHNCIFPVYYHVGYIKTYPECKAVYNSPWQLIMRASDGIVDELGERLPTEPVYNPPLSLYAQLVQTDYDAVYQDSVTKEVKFINLKGDRHA